MKNLKNGEAKDFRFGNVTFRKEGVYRFDITEKVPGTPAGGVTYDRHAAKVTVTVTDDADHPANSKPRWNTTTAPHRIGRTNPYSRTNTNPAWYTEPPVPEHSEGAERPYHEGGRI